MSCRAYGTALPFISLMRSAFLYTGIGPDILHAFKANGGRCIAKFWASVLVSGIREMWEEGMVIAAVPSLKRNIRNRGFDQVKLIIDSLPIEFSSKKFTELLHRDGGVAQKTLTRDERQRNLNGCITMSKGIAPKKVLLIDDICTTGATLSLCAKILKRNGCEIINAVTVFRD